MSFELNVRKDKGVPVVEVIGDLSGESVRKTVRRIERLLKTSTKTLAVDLSRTTFIDSKGIGAIVYCWRLSENRRRELLFIKPQEFILKMLRNTRLDGVFRIVSSVGER